MASVSTSLRTSLDIQTCAALFKKVGEAGLAEKKGTAMFGKAAAAIGGMADPSSAWGFYTPEKEPSPFDVLDAGGPQFSVGVNFPKSFGAGQGGATRVQMEVYDDDSVRTVALVADGSRKAPDYLNRFVSAFMSSDPSIEIVR